MRSKSLLSERVKKHQQITPTPLVIVMSSDGIKEKSDSNQNAILTNDERCNTDTETFNTKLNQSSEGDKEITSDPIVQYVLIRTDLNWSTGALIAQACHASIASISHTLDHTATKDYLKDLDNMHKVVLGSDKIEDLLRVESKLKEANIAHHLWVERPENIVTCLAASPQPKSVVQSIFKRLKLLK